MSRAPRTSSEDASTKEYLASWHATMKLLREGKSFSGRERHCVYLNCRDAGFANISAISGLDFADDGRAIAATDWDHDGDVDLWFANRTGPRLRFMRNNADPGPNARNFVVLKLRGTRSNRDAIGARVELLFQSSSAVPAGEAPRQVQTLTAGDGYLSQSSKYLHFGFDPKRRLAGVLVRWPVGQVEKFVGIEAGQRWLLAEGEFKAEPLPSRSQASVLTAETQIIPRPQDRSRTALASRPPLPILRYRREPDQGPSVLELGGAPILLVLWASWCPACLDELQTLNQNLASLAASNLQVVALRVDEISDGAPTVSNDTGDGNGFAKQIRVGVATRELVDKLRILQRVILNRQLPFAVPMSLLIDRDGDLAAIYRGPIPLDLLLVDLHQLEASPHQRRDNAVPFPGTWTTPPRDLLLRPIANLFREQGYLEDYDRLIQMEMSRLAERRQAAGSESERESLDRRFAVECFNLARSIQLQGQIDEAIAYYEQGMAVFDDAAEAHFHLGKAYLEKDVVQKAAKHFERAIELDATHVDACFEMAVLAASDQPHRAIDLFRRVVSLEPNHHQGWANLGAMLARDGQTEAAITAFRKALAINAGIVPAQMGLGGLLASRGRFGDALEHFHQAAKLEPELAPAHAALGQIYLALNQPVAAAEALDAAVTREPRDVRSLMRLAWLRATSWNESVRDGGRALALAQRLRSASNELDPLVLDLQAAAHAELGQFELAVAVAQEAIAATRESQVRLRAKIRRRIELYRQQRPFREPAPDQGASR